MTGRTPLPQGDQVEPPDILRAPLIAASAGIPPRSGQHSAHGRRGRTACACHPVGTGFRSTLDLPSCIGRPQRASSRACPNIRLRPGLRRTGPPSPRASADRSAFAPDFGGQVALGHAWDGEYPPRLASRLLVDALETLDQAADAAIAVAVGPDALDDLDDGAGPPVQGVAGVGGAVGEMSCGRRRPAAEAVRLAAARVRSPWVMVLFPCRRCVELPRGRGIAAATHRSETEAIRQGRARADGRAFTRPRSGLGGGGRAGGARPGRGIGRTF